MDELVARRERLANLGGEIAAWMGGVYQEDYVERAICRAAAEISGLTAETLRRLRDGEADGMDGEAANRFAELAKEEE